MSLSQDVSARYSPLTSGDPHRGDPHRGDPHRSGVNVHTAVLSVMYDVPSAAVLCRESIELLLLLLLTAAVVVIKLVG